MNVTALTLNGPGAFAARLRELGWEPALSATTASGVMPLAVRCSGLDVPTLEALVRHGGARGLDVLTGPDWAILAGSRARLGALARPWLVPEALRELATALGPVLPAEIAPLWLTAQGAVNLERPLVAGILNVTPDSFSDGGALTSVSAVLGRAEVLLEAGAGMLDIGGESTRPGRDTVVSEDEEIARTVPAITALARAHAGVPLSIDTMKSGVARAALDSGAWVVNDVSGLRLDPSMAAVVAGRRAGLVLMHSRGDNLELSSYAHASYADGVVPAVLAELRIALERASQGGIGAESIVVDPGLGFSKTPEQSLELLAGLEALLALGRPLYVGPSRKRFLRALDAREDADPDTATAVACALAHERGARIFRVHDVRRTHDALTLAMAVHTP